MRPLLAALLLQALRAQAPASPCPAGAERFPNGTIVCLEARGGARAAARASPARAERRRPPGGGRERGAKKARKPRNNVDDIGCQPGDADNMALPWSTTEGLAPLHTPWSGTLAPYLRARPRKCAIVVDRHVHKNGGSTVRDLFLEHERQGMALYQGYTQMGWTRDLSQLRKRANELARRNRLRPAPSGANESLTGLLLIEAHFGWVELSSNVMPGLLDLARLHAKHGIDCPLVMTTRVREPLDYYLSFYRWAVAFRQREAPKAFGADFVSWVRMVPNLQSTMMMQSMAAMAAEYHLSQYPQFVRSPIVGKSEKVAWEKLTAFLDAFTIVGTMRRFDESLLMAADLVGLPLMLYKRNRPNQKGGFRGTNATVCPDMELCRKAVREVAGRDHRMYDRYHARFEARLEALGPKFAARVAEYKRAVAEAQPLWKRAPRKQFICRYHPETSEHLQVLRPSNIRCPIEGGTELCRSVYAHRLFECPWQYRPNSSLSDPLGCWRPSSGFKR